MSNDIWNINGFRRTQLTNKLNSLRQKPLSVDDLYRTFLVNYLLTQDITNKEERKIVDKAYKDIQRTCDKNNKDWVGEIASFINHGPYNSISEIPKEYRSSKRLLINHYHRLIYFLQVYILTDKEIERFANHIGLTKLNKFKKTSQIYLLNKIFYGKRDDLIYIR